MDRRNYYYGKDIFTAEMTDLQDNVENSINSVKKILGKGIFKNGNLQINVLTLNIDETILFDNSGNTIKVNAQALDLSSYIPGSNKKIVSITAKFKRNYSQQETDDLGVLQYFKEDESYEILYIQSAVSENPIPPAIPDENVLIADVTLSFGMTEILTENISYERVKKLDLNILEKIISINDFIKKTTGSKYLVCSSSYLTADNLTVFNSITACLNYIKTDLNNRKGKIFIMDKGSPWQENIELSALDGDWSNIEIEFENTAVLEGIKNKAGNTCGSALLIDGAGADLMEISDRVFSFSGNIFTKISGTNLTIPSWGTSGFMIINRELYKFSNITTTSITLDASYKQYKGNSYNIIISALFKNFFTNIKIKGNIDCNFIGSIISNNALKGISAFACELDFKGNIKRAGDYYENYSEWSYAYYLNAQSGGAAGAILKYCTFSFQNIDSCHRDTESRAGGIHAIDSIVKGDYIKNCKGYSSGGGFYKNCHIDIKGHINNISSEDSAGGAYISNCSGHVGNIINNISASNGGGLYVINNSSITAGDIKKNNCDSDGAGIFISNSFVKARRIEENMGDQISGSGAYLYGNSKLQCETLKNNNSERNGIGEAVGGGFYINGPGVLICGLISGNISSTGLGGHCANDFQAHIEVSRDSEAQTITGKPARSSRIDKKIFGQSRSVAIVFASSDSDAESQNGADFIIDVSQNAVSAINTNIIGKEGIIYLTKGTFNVKEDGIVLTSNQTLRGSGAGTVIKRAVLNQASYIIAVNSTAENVNIENLTIDENGALFPCTIENTAIQVSGSNPLSRNIHVKNVTVKNAVIGGNTATFFTAFKNCDCYKCISVNNKNGGLGDINGVISFKGCIVDKCIAKDNQSGHESTVNGAFEECIDTHDCQALNNTATGGYDYFGFYKCKKMRYNNGSGNQNGNYSECDASTGTTNPVADTAAGGWNT
ncbi:MAG: hypothetical protein JXB50_12330 [Spirochaetes bacterium]|nr:hypothetical protein [Spirochaetota bacterium]